MGTITVDLKNKDKIVSVCGLNQWDYGQILQVSGMAFEENVEVHFSLQETGGSALVTTATIADGVLTAPIPNILLTEGCRGKIYAFIYPEDKESGQTVRKIVMHVSLRPRPDDYVYTETEVFSYKALADRVTALEENGVGGGVTSWNDLTDRPFGEEIESIEILPETTIEEVSTEYLTYSKSLVEGETYIVTYNGEQYTCIAQTMAKGAYVGNYYGYVLDDYSAGTGEPFYFGYGGTTWGLASYPSTVSIYSASTTVTQLDEKYIPNTIARVSDIPEVPEQVQSDWSVNDETSKAYIANRPFYEISETLISWDGTIGDKETVLDSAYVYMGDIDYSYDEILEFYLTTIYTGDLSIVSDTVKIGDLTIVDASAAVHIGYDPNTELYKFIIVDEDTDIDGVLLKKGIYAYAVNPLELFELAKTGEIKKIPSKFIDFPEEPTKFALLNINDLTIDDNSDTYTITEETNKDAYDLLYNVCYYANSGVKWYNPIIIYAPNPYVDLQYCVFDKMSFYSSGDQTITYLYFYSEQVKLKFKCNSTSFDLTIIESSVSEHTHEISDVTDLQSTLASKTEKFVVTIERTTSSSGPVYTSDKTFSEIKEAVNSNYCVVAYDTYSRRYSGLYDCYTYARFAYAANLGGTINVYEYTIPSSSTTVTFKQVSLQSDSSDDLETTSKYIVGAINELNTNKVTKDQVTTMINEALGVIENGSY